MESAADQSPAPPAPQRKRVPKLRIALTLDVADDQNIPAANRIRQWLKIGLRGFGIHCVEIQEAVAPSPPHSYTNNNGPRR